MKNRITSLFAIILGLSNCVFAQQSTKANLFTQKNPNPTNTEVKKRALEDDLPQIQYTTYWDRNNNDWANIWDTINMSYYTNGLMSERNRKYSWGGNFNVTNYEYDGAGRETFSIELQYSSDMSTKDTNSISITEYDENGLISKSIRRYNYSGDWSDSNITTYENKVDGNGRITEQTMQEWDGDLGQMVNDQKVLFSYGSDNKINKLELQYWDDSAQSFVSQITYDTVVWHIYIENDAMLELSKPAYVSGGGNMDGTEMKLRIQFEYDEHDNEITQTTYMSADGGQNWMEDLGGISEYTYDTEGRCIERKEKYFDQDSGFYIYNNKDLFSNFYAAPNLKVNYELELVNIFPNPSNEYITITGEINEYVIYSLQGNMVKRCVGRMSNPKVDVSNLNDGFYWVNWSNTNGKTFTQKLQVN